MNHQLSSLVHLEAKQHKVFNHPSTPAQSPDSGESLFLSGLPSAVELLLKVLLVLLFNMALISLFVSQ